MERRNFLKAAAIGAGTIALGEGFVLGESYFPTKVDENLFKDINRAKDPMNKTDLEKSHSPVITAPQNVKAGEAFDVEVAIGEHLHPMLPQHWIEYVQLDIGNEPAGTVTFDSKGFLKPKAKFSVVLPDELKGKKISLVATNKCNLHGIWQTSVNVEVA
jgi:superoxide reductase